MTKTREELAINICRIAKEIAELKKKREELERDLLLLDIEESSANGYIVVEEINEPRPCGDIIVGS